MDQRPNVSIEDSAKPSKLLALIALVIAFALPFVLVKSFPHKQKFNYSTEEASYTASELEEESPSNKKPELQKHSLAIPAPAPNKTVAATNRGTTAPAKLAQAPTAPPPGSPAKSARTTDMAAKAEATTATAKSTPAIKPAQIVAQTTGDNDWKIVKTRRGDSFASVFSHLGLNPHILKSIIQDNPQTKVFSNLKADQQLEFLIKNHNLEKMIVPLTSIQYLVIYREGQHYKSKINSHKTNSHNHFVTGSIHGSLYTTAKRLNIPYKLIQQMTEIFNGNINFAKDVRAGDQFTIIYKALYIEDKLVGTGDIVAVTYRNKGKTFQAVRHTDRSGHSEYYNADGTSLRKSFNRYPLRFSHISSSFSAGRNHPILRYRRPHKGVDLAAPIGTPIMATGDGRIEIIGRQSGYGNMIKINHNQTYSTVYGHMLKFQKGLSKGSYVKRGQIIGYVGQTGLATGPHCHYEFHINRQAKNPTTVDLPKGFPIVGQELASFKANAATLLAQLKLFEQGRLANTSPKKSSRTV